MANSDNLNPMFADSTGVLSDVGGCITAIVWSNGSAGDVLELGDNQGNIVFKATIHSDNFPVVFTPAKPLPLGNGLKVTTIDGGTNTLQNIPNSSLTNSSVTYNGVNVALGGSGTITATICGKDLN